MGQSKNVVITPFSMTSGVIFHKRAEAQRNIHFQDAMASQDLGHPDKFTGEAHNARRKELEQAAWNERIAKGPMGMIDDIVGAEVEPLPVRRQE